MINLGADFYTPTEAELRISISPQDLVAGPYRWLLDVPADIRSGLGHDR
jgi:hypothetical protein